MINKNLKDKLIEAKALIMKLNSFIHEKNEQTNSNASFDEMCKIISKRKNINIMRNLMMEVYYHYHRNSNTIKTRKLLSCWLIAAFPHIILQEMHDKVIYNTSKELIEKLTMLINDMEDDIFLQKFVDKYDIYMNEITIFLKHDKIIQKNKLLNEYENINKLINQTTDADKLNVLNETKQEIKDYLLQFNCEVD